MDKTAYEKENEKLTKEERLERDRKIIQKQREQLEKGLSGAWSKMFN